MNQIMGTLAHERDIYFQNVDGAAGLEKYVQAVNEVIK